jgi:hypothetical protein
MLPIIVLSQCKLTVVRTCTWFEPVLACTPDAKECVYWRSFIQVADDEKSTCPLSDYNPFSLLISSTHCPNINSIMSPCILRCVSEKAFNYGAKQLDVGVWFLLGTAVASALHINLVGTSYQLSKRILQRKYQSRQTTV